jgi:hypothetical protein
MDLKKLERDWATDPCLKYCCDNNVNELAERLLRAHKYMMSEAAGPLGYLYQAQVRLIRELKHEQRERQTGGR